MLRAHTHTYICMYIAVHKFLNKIVAQILCNNTCIYYEGILITIILCERRSLVWLLAKTQCSLICYCRFWNQHYSSNIDFQDKTTLTKKSNHYWKIHRLEILLVKQSGFEYWYVKFNLNWMKYINLNFIFIFSTLFHVHIHTSMHAYLKK